MKVRRCDRKKDIIEYLKKNPFSSMDSIFTKGKIPKSETTINLVNNMILDGVIQISQTKTGKKRHYILDNEFKKNNPLYLIKLDIEKIKTELKITKEKNPILSRLCDRFSKLLDLRIRILELEFKHAKITNKSFNGDGLREITARWDRFANNFILDVSFKRLKDFEQWIGSKISGDMYYLEHHANTSKPRSLAEKMQISDNRTSFHLSRQTQIHHQESLKSKNDSSENQYDEIFKRLNAEQNRVLVSNPADLVTKILREVCVKRLDMIKKKRSKRFNSERIILKDTIMQMDQNPMLLPNLLKEKEMED